MDALEAGPRALSSTDLSNLSASASSASSASSRFPARARAVLPWPYSRFGSMWPNSVISH
jgi:hypothetical protein